MTVKELIESLQQFDPNLRVEIATCDREDEWYEIFDLRTSYNYCGKEIVVIDTD